MTPRRFAVAALILVFAPSVAHACTCAVMPLPRASTAQPQSGLIPLPLFDHWEGRAAIFRGHVIEVDPPEVGARPRVVRFVTEASWRGKMPDTVTVVVEGAPCTAFFVGNRYVIAADVDSATRRLASRDCMMSHAVLSPAYARFTEIMGAPTWTAPPVGRRAIDAAVVRLGTPRPRTPTPTSVVVGLPPTGHSQIARFEVADFNTDGLSARAHPTLHLEPGLYQVRLTWSDGEVMDMYMSVRCERRYDDGQCAMHRSFTGLR